MRSLTAQIAAALARGEAVALATVVGRRGSLPMGRSAKLLVGQDGAAHGTIGGGCLEAEVYAAGRELMGAGGSRLDSFSLIEIEDGIEGHICGGTVTVLTEAIRPTPAARALFSRLRECQEARLPVVLATRLPDDKGTAHAVVANHVLVCPEGTVNADPDAEIGDDLREVCAAALQSGDAVVTESSMGSYFVEPHLPNPAAVIFGAGHCGRAIGSLASTAGFRVAVLDDRPAFLDSEAMPWADEIHCVEFEDALAQVDVGVDPYYVIVTRGHDHDLTVLRQVLDRPSAYLGMIGSVRKRRLFERTLAAEGVDEDALQRLYSPMGLPIAADSPEEIAVSVLGQMIGIRRGAAGKASGREVRRSRRQQER